MDSKPLLACFLIPIPEIAVASVYLDAAVYAHLSGAQETARELIHLADMSVIREKWTERLWGKPKPYVPRLVADVPPIVDREHRQKVRNPEPALKAFLHCRDGYHCRFCGIPVIRKAVRNRLRQLYPGVARWGVKNIDQHAALQAMWAQYDHIVPHCRGGSNEPDNLVVTCAPCNFARMHYTLEQVGLDDPRKRQPLRSSWDGLERILLPSEGDKRKAIQDTAHV